MEVQTVKIFQTFCDRLFRVPLLWGMAAGFLFYAVMRQGPLHSPFFARYADGHWILQVEFFLFFGAMAVLVAKLAGIARQRSALNRFEHSVDPSRRIAGRTDDYLLRRMRDAAELVRRTIGTCSASTAPVNGAGVPGFPGSGNGGGMRPDPDRLDARLRELSEQDADRAHADYGLVRLVIWAIPIFGFLGTVIGITLAIAQLNGNALEEAMPQVTAGLGVAFDTTAVALSLSMVLMFGQYFVNRRESALLAAIESFVSREVSALVTETLERPTTGSVLDDGGIRSDRTVTDTEIVRQYWETFFAEARREWTVMVQTAGEQLAGAASEVFQAQLARSQAELLGQMADFSRQIGTLVRLTEELDGITQAEVELNRNLASLAGARHFEQTVTSLAAAIQLLSTRIGDLPATELPSVTFRRTA